MAETSLLDRPLPPPRQGQAALDRHAFSSSMMPDRAFERGIPWPSSQHARLAPCGAHNASAHSRNTGCTGRHFLLSGPQPLRSKHQGKGSMKFQGTKDYVATEDLKVAVNASIVLERPLLIKGEPGTGKTVLAEEVAKAIKAPLLTWHIKSTTKAQQGLYEYDAVSRLRDSQLGDSRVSDISNYIKRGKLWDAFTSEQRPVLLIDEIDKADIEFPNDLLLELDRMEFHVYENRDAVKAQ